jgi:hypothetical protein
VDLIGEVLGSNLNRNIGYHGMVSVIFLSPSSQLPE